MKFELHEIIRFRRSCGFVQSGRVAMIFDDALLVTWCDEGKKYGKLIEANQAITNKKECLSAKLLVEFLGILVTKMTVKRLLVFILLSMFLNGIYSNYCSLESRHKEAWFKPEIPSIWKVN